MNWTWFHKLGFAQMFYGICRQTDALAGVAAFLLISVGCLGAGLRAARLPAGRRLPHPLHPRAERWMSMSIFALMAVCGAIALIWRIKLCEILAMAARRSAPVYR